MPLHPLFFENSGGDWTQHRHTVAANHDKLATRCVQPEILDRLPQNSPAARASRRDLRLINLVQRNAAWFHRLLRRHCRPHEYVLELGAGTGELGRNLHADAIKMAGLDLGRRPADWPGRAPWYETDVLNFSHWADYPIIIGNLFFHHFSRSELKRLGERLSASARLIVACDPLRARRTANWFSLVCPLIRAHPVTRHDGRVSIAAGFRNEELPLLLQLDPTVWRWRTEETWLGACRLVAERRP